MLALVLTISCHLPAVYLQMHSKVRTLKSTDKLVEMRAHFVTVLSGEDPHLQPPLHLQPHPPSPSSPHPHPAGTPAAFPHVHTAALTPCAHPAWARLPPFASDTSIFSDWSALQSHPDLCPEFSHKFQLLIGPGHSPRTHCTPGLSSRFPISIEPPSLLSPRV